MIYQLLPFEIFGIEFITINEILNFLNKLWFMQIFICFAYCLKIKRYLPNNQSSIFLKQFYIYLLANAMVYVVDMLVTNIFFNMFERFFHHIIAILIFYATYLEQSLLCVTYLTPYLLHSLYWLNIFSNSNEFVLMIYNLTLLLSCLIGIWKTYNTKVKLCSLRILILTGLLFNVNMFGYMYDYYVEIFNLDLKKAFFSFFISILVSMPYYYYLFYVNFKTSYSFNNKKLTIV